MKEEYYIPDIEDIHVGYEYELASDDAKTNWQPTIQGRDFEGLDFYINEGYIRVPFLTKKQIEAEGWKMKDKYNDSNRFIKDNYIIFYYYKEHLLTIIMKRENKEDVSIFGGECKDINTFRYILKLLKI